MTQASSPPPHPDAVDATKADEITRVIETVLAKIAPEPAGQGGTR